MSGRKTKGSSIATLIHQWASGSQPDHSSYRILLQHTTGLTTRLQAANSTFKDNSMSRQLDDEIVYRRAGLRTPAESALRELFGGAAWLVSLLEAGVETTTTLTVCFIRTLSRPSWVPPELLSKLTVVDASHNPWGWDDDTELHDDGVHKSVQLQDLPHLYDVLRRVVTDLEGKPVMLVWESLAPLIMVHGFDQVLRFLEALDKPVSGDATADRILQIWPIRTETLTPSQHAKLEDAANALMNLNRGEMTMMRQGVRESGNIVREIMPFRLVPRDDTTGGNSLLPFRLEEQEENKGGGDGKDPPALRDEQSRPDSAPTHSHEHKPPESQPGRSKMRLQHEPDDQPASRTSKAGGEVNDLRPRIFLQDDDPEFDDMDEEDPDDDLDI
jgi:hypothetical protein